MRITCTSRLTSLHAVDFGFVERPCRYILIIQLYRVDNEIMLPFSLDSFGQKHSELSVISNCRFFASWVAHDQGVEIWKYKFLFYGFTYDVLDKALDSCYIFEDMFVRLANLALDIYRRQ